MEKLDKVIAGLECCCDPDKRCENGDSGCPYHGEHGDDKFCLDLMMEDALDGIERLREENLDLRKDVETLHRINEDWRDEVARLHKRIDEARAEGARLSGVAAKCEKPKTRYEWIRGMSPMQMVNWIYHMKAVCDCCDRHYICGVPDDKVTEEYCLEHILLWLGQEVEK